MKPTRLFTVSIFLFSIFIFSCTGTIGGNSDSNKNNQQNAETSKEDKPINTEESSVEKVIFLNQLARYCVDQDENLRIVCESFEISPAELFGINSNGQLEVVTTDNAKIRIPLQNEIRREAMNILMKRR